MYVLSLLKPFRVINNKYAGSWFYFPNNTMLSCVREQ